MTLLHATPPGTGAVDPVHGAHRPLRVLVVAESFLPQVNGVTKSVCMVLDHLARRGYEAQVVAPTGPETYAGFAVHTVASRPMPLNRGFEIGVASRRRLEALMRTFAPDVVHLASPAVLGAQAASTARSLRIPTVAIFQTDLVGFARRWGVPGADLPVRTWTRHVHGLVDRTLVPSTASLRQLESFGVDRLAWWPRGVDLAGFGPGRRSAALRGTLAPAGEVLVGYVGRLAPEKQLHHLRHLHGLPGIRLLVVGAGQSGPRLRRLLPGARFLGEQHGEQLAETVASLDVFVHTGADETYCQSAQEALASGVPVVAPAAGGLLDLVRPGVNGLLYPPDDGAAIRPSVHRLVVDRGRREAMSAEARRGVLGRSWEAVCDDLLGHYRDVLECRARDTVRAAR